MATTISFNRPDGKGLSVCMAREIDAGVVWYGCPPLEHVP
jgi:hypothetical protein